MINSNIFIIVVENCSLNIMVPSFDLQYRKNCQIEDHQHENICYFCSEDSCENSPLLCALCAHGLQSPHKSHETKPIKYYLNELHRDMHELNRNACVLAKVDKSRHFIYELGRSIEDSGIREILLITLQQFFLNVHITCCQDQLRTLFEGLLRKNEGDCSELLIAYCKKWNKSYDEDRSCLTNYSRIVQDIIKDLEEKEKILTQAVKNQNIEMSIVEMFTSTETAPRRFYFDSKSMNSGLTCIDKTKVSISDYADYNYYAVCQPPLSKGKLQCLKFKMNNISSYVSVGVCIKNKVQGNYEFMANSLGHGSYQLSYDGYVWSDHDSALNQQYSGWYFSQGDIITVEVNPNTKNIRFIKNSNFDQAYSMGYQIGKNDKLHFCVTLNCSPEEVEIVE